MTGLILGGLAGGGAAAAGGGAILGTVLSGVSTVLGVVSALRDARAQSEAAIDNAAEVRFEERQVEAESLARTTELKKRLLAALGENAVAYAAAGLDLGQGVAEENRQRLRKDAATGLTIERRQTEARRATLRARAAGYLRIASDARSRGVFDAIRTGIGGIRSMVAP